MRCLEGPCKALGALNEARGEKRKNWPLPLEPLRSQDLPPQRSLRGGLRGLLKKTTSRRLWFAPRFEVPYSKGDLTGYSPAACRANRAAHSCLWDWELCRPPEGFRLELPRLPASARSPCSTAPGSLSLGLQNIPPARTNR